MYYFLGHSVVGLLLNTGKYIAVADLLQMKYQLPQSYAVQI